MVETLWWAAVAVATWLATLSSVTLPELCFAVATAVPSGAAATATRRALHGSWRFRPRWLLLPLLVPIAVLAELPALGRVALRRRAGGLRTLQLPPVPARLRHGRSAALTLAVSATPGSLVVHDDARGDRLVVHLLVSAGPRIEEVVGGERLDDR